MIILRRGGQVLNSGRGGGGGAWHKASVSDCLPLATPIGLSPLHILTLCGPERVLVVSTEPPDDLSCLTTPGVGRPGDGAVARAVDRVHPDAHSESMRGFASGRWLGAGRHLRRPLCRWCRGAALDARAPERAQSLAPPALQEFTVGQAIGSANSKYPSGIGNAAVVDANGLLATVLDSFCMDRCSLAQGCVRREGTSEADPAAVRQAVGGGCPSDCGRLLSVTNAIEPGTWRQGDRGWA